jgi:dethiobiotin synthetase
MTGETGQFNLTHLACLARATGRPMFEWRGMKARTWFITGTDTGAGKTVLAEALTRHLRARGVRAAALKPICSGGRNDARILRSAAGGVLSLDEVNPWHFRAPLAPLLAARREGRRVRLREVEAWVQQMRERFEVVVVEGAGGLLSPLGEDFDSRELIVALRAIPVVVCPNRLGVVNQARLVVSALPETVARKAHVALMAPRHLDEASRTNAELLGEFLGRERVQVFPWIALRSRSAATLPAGVARKLDEWVEPILEMAGRRP